MSTPRPGALARCVGDVDEFLEKVWTRSYLLREQVGGDRFADLLSLDHVDEMLSTMALRPPAFRLVENGKPLPESTYTRSGRMGSRTLTDLADPAKVYERFHGGATVVLQGLQRWWAPLARFCRDIELTLTHPVQANAYLTPPGAQGLRVHHDTHDVLALQTHGRKRWALYEAVVDDPVADLYLEPGDCLYLPRGTLHAAATVDVASLHVTIGIRSITWHDVFRRLVEQVADVPAFAAALPAGFADDPHAASDEVAARLRDLSTWLGERDGVAVAESEARRFWSSRPPLADGQLSQVLGSYDIDDRTEVEIRPLASCRLYRDGDALVVALGDRGLRLPGYTEPAMTLIVDRKRLRAADLAGILDEDGRLVLVRRMVREGLLRIVA